MEIEYSYEKKEFIKGYQQVAKKSKMVKGYDVFLYIGCIVASYFIQGNFRILTILAGLIGMGGLYYQLYLKPKRIFDKVEMFQEGYRIVIDDNGIDVHTNNASGLHPWNKIKKIDSDKNFYYIEEDNGGFLFLPIRAFSDMKKKEFDRMILILDKTKEDMQK